MQAYDQAVVSASKVISEAIISDLDCVIDNGFGLDDLITDISRRINHQVTQQAMNAASSRLVSPYKQQGWQPLRNKLVQSCLWANDVDRALESLMLQYQQSENDGLRKLIAYLERFRECVSYGYVG